MNNLVLRPNCLLTKAPICFITGPRSIFHFKEIGSELQEFLYAHGYLIRKIPLPFRNPQQRRQVFQRWLDQNRSQNFHFVMSQQTWNEFQNELQTLKKSTYTILGENFEVPLKTKWQIPLTYKLHQIFCFLDRVQAEPFEQTIPNDSYAIYNRFLDHFINLAENEYTGDFDEPISTQ